MKTIKLTQLIFPVLTVSLSACSFKSVPKNAHEAAAKPEVKTEQVRPASQSEFDQIDLQKIYNELRTVAQKTPAEQLKIAQSAVEALKPILLTEKFIEDPKTERDQRLQSMLFYFNQSLTILIGQNQLPAETLEAYVRLVKRGCNNKYEGCINIGFFSRDPRSLHMVLAKAKQLDQALDNDKLDEASKLAILREYYFYVLLGSELRNRQPSEDLNYHLIKRARDFSHALSDKATPEETVLLNKIGRIFEISLSEITGNETDPRVKDLIRASNPWSYSLLDQSSFSFGSKKLFFLASKWHLYDDKGVISEDIKKVIAASQSQADELGDSFSKAVQTLKSNDKSLINNLKADEVQIESEYFYLVDRYYRGHISIDEVLEVWGAIIAKKKDTALNDILHVMNNYIRWQFLKLIYETKTHIRDVYQKGDFEPYSLVEKVLQSTRELDQKWSTLISRSERLMVFIDRTIKLQFPNSDKVEQVTNLIKNLAKNTKFFASYPNMQLLTYFLRTTTSPAPIQTYFGVVNFPPGIIMNAFIDGYLDSWFNFGGDLHKLSQTEILLTYDMALRTGTFQNFKGVGGRFQVDEAEFIKQVTKEYFSDEKKKLVETQNRLENILQRPSFSDFRNLCRGIRSVELEYKDLDKFLFFGYSPKDVNSHSGLITALNEFYYSGSHTSVIASELNYLNQNFLKKRMVIDYMNKVMIDYLTANSKDQKEIDSVKKNAQEEIADYETKLQKQYDDIVKLHRELSTCTYQALNTEQEMMMALLKEEAQFMGKIWDHLKALNGKKLEENSDLVKNILTESTSQGEDRFEAGPSYRYTKIGLLGRMTARLTQTKIQVYIKGIPDILDLKRSYGQSFRMEIKEGDKELSRDEFIAKYMRRLNGTAGSMLDWISTMTDGSDFIRNKIKFSLELYRTGQIVSPESKTKFSGGEAVEEIISHLRYFNITSEQENILRLLGLTTTHKFETVRTLFFKGNDHAGAMDFAFNLLKSSALDRDDAPTALENAEEFFKIISSLGKMDSFIFKPSSQTIDTLRKSYNPLVKNYSDQFQNFMAEIARCETNENCKNISIRYDLNPAKTVYRSAIDERGAYRLLSSDNHWYIDSRMNKFHNVTGGCFKQDAPAQCGGQ